MGDLETNERKSQWRFWLCLGAGLITAIFTFFVIVLIYPAMPFSFWICVFGGYVGYRTVLGLTTPAKSCSKCGEILPKGARTCPKCGKLVLVGLE